MTEQKEDQTKNKAQQRREYRRKRKANCLKKKLKLSIPAPEGLKKSWERENRIKKLRSERAQKILQVSFGK